MGNKLKTAVILLILCLSFVGCSAMNKEDKSVVKISLESNPSTGYSWEYDISDESVIKFVSEEYDDKKDESNKELVGVPGESIFTFKGQKEGKSTIILKYKRRWEKEAIFINTYEYEVDKDKNVQLIRKQTKENK